MGHINKKFDESGSFSLKKNCKSWFIPFQTDKGKA